MTDSFAERLAYALEVRGMKQIELAEETGISKSAISQYLSGAGHSSPEVTSKHYTRVFDASLKEAAMIYHDHLHGDGNHDFGPV